MPGRLNKSCAADGVIAYQDTDESNMFHYFPARIDSIANETLLDFSVKYWGINANPYYIDVGKGKYESIVGATVSGQAVADITKKQRDAITKEIRRVFQLKPKDEVVLVPLVLQEVEVQPILAGNVVEKGGGSSVTFPSRFQIGTQFGFNIGSGNSLFSELVANEGSLDRQSSPDIGVNFYGTAELRADKWVARIEADLSQVWSYTRKKVSASLKLGWLNLGGADLDKIVQSLRKENIVKITYIEGGGGKEFGRALLESSKALFEAINAQITSGEGLFRFEPNPKPQEPPAGKDSLGGDLLPWKVSLNMSFGENTFQQSIKYDQTITFEGNTLVAFNGNMSLALPCNASTTKYFYDLQLKQDGCITAQKSDGLQSRIGKELAAKNEKVRQYFNNVEQGRWTPDQMATMLELLNQTTLTEQVNVVQQPDGVVVLEPVPLEQASAAFDTLVAGRVEAQSEPLPVVARMKVAKVFPPDTRKRVNDTKTAPWNAIGQLVVKFPSGNYGYGTGTLLGGRHVLTAAHVLYLEDEGGRAVSARFYPGKNGVLDPFGGYDMTSFNIDDEYPQKSEFADYDYALITLSEEVFPGFANFRLRNVGDDGLENLDVEISGYPMDKPLGTLWTASGKLTAVTARTLRYRISTTAGQSGSAVAFFGGESWDIVGIHSGESGDANAACRVTDRVVHAIREWMSYDAVEIAEEGCECDDVPA